MPRDGSRAYRSEVVHNGFFASASRKQIRKPGGRHRVQTEGWQDEAWKMFDTVGEFHAACVWISNMASKAKLEVWKDGKKVTDENDPALRALNALYGGPEEQQEMMRLFALHLTVAGDCYLVGVSGGDDEDDDWDIHSNLRIKPSGNWYKIEDETEDIPARALVMRLWRKHPLERKKGDCNARAALPILRELDTMTQRVAADSESRLTGAGLLILPNEVTFPSRIQTKEGSDNEIVATTTGLDAFMEMLIEVASLSIADQSSAAAKVPIVVQMPGDQIAKVKLINFWSEYDAAMKELRNEAIRRLSLALDMPPEVLTGMADANHWTAWQMEEAAIKVHTEPLLKLIVSSLNDGYLWPYLDDEGMDEDEIRRYSFHADTTELRLRPNLSKEALELNDRGILKDEVTARENGFGAEDLMDDNDRKMWVLRKLAQGSPTPGMVLGAVAALGVDPDEFLRIMRQAEGQQQPEGERGQVPLERSLEDHPVREIPDTQDDAIAAAADVVVMRALERAGNRLKNRMGPNRPEGVAAVDLYRFTPLKAADLDDLLEDAWSACGRLSTTLPVEQINAYVRNLMLNAKEHDPAVMRRYLRLAKYALGEAA